MRRASKAARVVLAGTALLLALSACEDEGDTPAAEGAPQLSRSEFTAAVDEICAADRDALTDLEAPRGLKGAPEFLREVLPVIREQLVRVRELGDPPAEGAETYLDWLQARDGIVQTTAQMIEAAESGDRDQFQRLAILQQQLDEKADEAAEEYGFEVCGVGTS